MSNLTDFFPSGGGGGLTPKFQEFNASGTFTPTQALIDAGGYIEVFLVGGGERGINNNGGAGGEVQTKVMYLTSTTACSVTIGAAGVDRGDDGGSSTFSGSSAGGSSVTSTGGDTQQQANKLGAGWSAYGTVHNAGSGSFGYGAGGAYFDKGGVLAGKVNSGQGSGDVTGGTAGSGYCLIKWYE